MSCVSNTIGSQTVSVVRNDWIHHRKEILKIEPGEIRFVKMCKAIACGIFFCVGFC